MSQLKTSKKRTFGNAWERIWDSLTGGSRPSNQERKPRRLAIDPLEERQLLSVTANSADDVLLTQIATAGQDSVSGKAVAADNNGDYVVVWSRNDGVIDSSGVVIDPDTGVAMTDYNVYARYLTQAVQRVDLGQGTTSFNLQYNGNAVQQLTLSSGSVTAIVGDFDLVYTDTSGLSYSATVTGYDQSRSLSANVAAIQNALNSLYTSGVTDLEGVNVIGVDSLNYQICYSDAAKASFLSGGQPTLIVGNTNFSTGYLVSATITTLRQPGTTLNIVVSSDPTLTAEQNMAQTAQNIEYAFSQATSTTYTTAPIIDGPSKTVSTTRIALPGVSVTARSEYEFDITFTGDYGLQTQPLLVLTAYDSSYATVPDGAVHIIKQSTDEFRVNNVETDNPNTNRIDVYDQYNAQVAMDADGDFVITWESDSTTTGSYTDIYARRFSAAGFIDGVTQTITFTSTSTLSTGTFTLTTDKGTSGAISFDPLDPIASANNIKYALNRLGYDPSSVTVTPSSATTSVTTIEWNDAASIPVITCTPNSSWTSTAIQSAFASNNVSYLSSITPNTTNLAGQASTYFQSIRALGDQFLVNTILTNTQSDPSVGMDSDGNFTIAWASMGQDLSYFNTIKAQRYDRDGNKLGDEFQVNTIDNTTASFSPYVAMSASGAIAIGWNDTNDPNYYQHKTYIATVYAKVYSGQGAVLLNQFAAGGGGITGIDFDSADNFVIGCAYNTSNDNISGKATSDVFVTEWELYDSNGAVSGKFLRTQFRANSATFNTTDANMWPNSQYGGQPVMDADGDLTVFYEGFGADTSETVSGISYSLFSSSLLQEDNVCVTPYLNLFNLQSIYQTARTYSLTYSETGDKFTSIDVDTILENILAQCQAPMCLGTGIGFVIGTSTTASNGITASDTTFYAVLNDAMVSPSLSDIKIDGEAMSISTITNITSYSTGYSVYKLTVKRTASPPTSHSAGSTVVNPSITMTNRDYVLGRIREIFESKLGLLRGTANDVLFSQFDSDPNSSAACRVLNSDSVANNTRDGSNSRYYIDIDKLATGGTFSLKVINSKNIETTVPISIQATGTSLDATKMIAAIEDALRSSAVLKILGINWDETLDENDGTRHEGTVSVRLISDAEIAAKANTDWDFSSRGVGDLTTPSTGAPYYASYIYEITFLGESHDTYISLSLDTTTTNAKLTRSDGSTALVPTVMPLLAHDYTYPDYNGTQQSNVSAAMATDGDFITVWTQFTPSNTAGSIGINNIYFRTFSENSDTAGANVTDFLLADGDRLNNNDTVTDALTRMVVTFDEELMITGDNSVTNVNNWALMRDGVLISNAIESVSFGLNESYWERLNNTTTFNKWEAVVTFNADVFSEGLSDGHYQLVAKRTIFDANGNPLASTGYNTNGADFSRTFDVLRPTGTETIVNDTQTDNSQITTSQATASDADGDSIVAWATQSGQTLTFTFASTPTANTWFRLKVDSDLLPTSNIQFVPAGTTLTASNIQTALSKLSVFGKQAPNLTVAFNSLKSTATTFVFDLVYGSMSTVTVQPTITQFAPTGASTTPLPTGTLGTTPVMGAVYATVYDVTWGTDSSGNRVELSKTPHLVSVTENMTASDVAVACDDKGNFVVTWSQYDTDGSGWNVHAALYNFDRTLKKSDFVVNATPASAQHNAAVAMDSDGDFTVAWQSNYQDGSGYGIYATRFDADGNRTGGINERSVLTFDVKFTGTFKLTWQGATSTTAVRFNGNTGGPSNPNSDFIIQLKKALVEIGLNAEDGAAGQVVQVTNLNGTQVRIEFINARGNSNQLGITVETNDIIVDSGSSGTVTASTEREGSLAEFQVNDTTDNDQLDPDIAMDDAGNFVITWTSYGQGGDNTYESNIYSKLFTASSGSDSGSQFNVTVHFSGGLSASQQLVFAEAAARWESIIVGDVADVMTSTGYIDDILIDASGIYIDGEGGILGQAGPTGLRTGSDLPYAGIMQFDTADLADMETNGSLLDVITHEMGHVLGFGTIWTDLNLLTGAGGDDPEFVGAGAVAEYNKAYGLTATSVPVENTGGSGTRDSHWRESVFGNELMTGWINSGTNVLSRMTAASLGDLGYQVNVDAAAVQFLSNLYDDDVQVGNYYGHMDVLQTSYTYADAVSSVTGGGREVLVNSIVSGNQRSSSVAMDADGDFVITWTSFGQDSGNNSTTANGEDGIFARRYDKTGKAVGNEFCVNTFTDNNQQYSDVAMNAAGDFVVVWQSYQDKDGSTDTPNSYGIYGQRFVRNGLVSTTTAYGSNGQYLQEFAINTTTDGNQLYPSVSMDDNGDFIVVWSGNGTKTTPKDNQGVFLQAFRQLTDTAGPRVVMTIDTTQSPNNILLNMETVANTVKTIKVTFTEMLNTDKAGQAGWNYSVLNPNNWSISKDGSTIAYGVTVYSYTFDDATNTYEVVLQCDVDPKTSAFDPLDSGSYILTLSANVRDVNGVALDGNDDGVAGGDFQRAFTINTGSGGGGGGDGGNIPGPGTPTPGTTDTPINTGTLLGGQEDVVTASGSNGYIIVWEDAGIIYGQRYDASGNVVGLLTANTLYGLHPDVAMNSDGDIVIVWEGYGSDGNYGIFARCYNADGNVKGDPIRVSQISLARQESPSVAVASNGNFIVTWTKYNVSGNLFGNIYGRTFRGNGTSLTSEYLISTNTSRTNINSDVAISNSGSIVVVWEGYNSSSNWDIYGQKLLLPKTSEIDTKAINFVGGEFLVNSYTSNLQQDPSVAVDDSGNFVVSWSSYLQDGSLWGVYARQFYATGAARTSSEFRVNSITSSYQWQSDVSCDSNGNFTVAWSSYGKDDVLLTDYGVYAHIYNATGGEMKDSSGTVIGEFRINATTAGDQTNPAVTMTDNGNVVLAWLGPIYYGTSGTAVFARLVGLSGSSSSSKTVLGDSLVLSTSSDGTVVWNNGSSTVLCSTAATVICVGDYDGDGYQDDAALAFTSGPYQGTYIRYNITESSGVWKKIHDRVATSLLAADANGDGADELFLGLGTGWGFLEYYTTASTWRFLSGKTIKAIAVADLDSNEKDDLVFSLTGQNGTSTLMNNGASKTLYATAASSIAIGDLNGDGQVNDVVLDLDASGLWVRYDANSTSGTMTKINGFNAQSVAVADLDGNGADEVVAEFGALFRGVWDFTNASKQWVNIGNGKGTSNNIKVADVNADGHEDLVVSYGNTIGTLAWVANSSWTNINSKSVAAMSVSKAVAALTLDGTALVDSSAATLTEAELDSIVAEAINRLSAELGSYVASTLASVNVKIASLDGATLGETAGTTILIDDDAAGYGWFVDSTPSDDAEYAAVTGSTAMAALKGSAAATRVDLLTTVMHEMEHVLGYGHSSGLMSDKLGAGVRYSVETNASAVDNAYALLYSGESNN
ncbi:MAG: hypothetical protein LLF97_11820 [Planctomycetaceae bacterium]|nr:hypothetical protein [Planctomycetaceae bacterium]